MGLDVTSSPSLPLRIEVLDGPLATQSLLEGQPPGTISLSGWSGPFRPVKHGGSTMRQKTTAYAGNPEATQQVIGKVYKPTTFEGMWSDRYLGNGAARALVDVFEAVLSSGATVRVSWGEGALPDGSSASGSAYVRVGMLTDFDPELHNVRDWGWSATFAWKGKGDSFTPAVAAAQVLNPREGFQEAQGDLLDATNAAQTFVARRSSPIPQFLLDGVDQAVTDMTSAADAIDAISSQVTELATFPSGAASALVGAADLAVTAAFNLEQSMFSLDPSHLLLPTDAGIQLLNAKISEFFVLDECDAVKDSSTRAADGAAQMIVPEVIAEVTLPTGTDLRDLALKYYGDADMWWAIANYNGYATSDAPAPPSAPSDRPALVVIKVPRLQGGPQSDLRQNC